MELGNLVRLYFNQSYQFETKFQLQSNIHQFLKRFMYERHNVSHTLRSKKVSLNRLKNIIRILKQEQVFTHHEIIICIKIYSTETH